MKHQQLSTMPYVDRTWTKWITKNKNKGNMSQKNRKHYYFLTPVRHGNNSLNMINLAVKHFLVSPKTSTPNSYRPSPSRTPCTARPSKTPSFAQGIQSSNLWASNARTKNIKGKGCKMISRGHRRKESAPTRGRREPHKLSKKMQMFL